MQDQDPISERKFAARIAEYASARDETLGSISNQHLVLTFGTASLVGLFAAGFLAWNDDIAPAIFFAVVPLTGWVLLLWAGEVVRMMRAIAFCRTQADLINQTTFHGDDVFRWETWRREEAVTIEWPYVAVGTAMALIDLAALVAAWCAHSARWGLSWMLGLTLVLGAAALGEGIWLLRAAIRWYEDAGGPRSRLFGWRVSTKSARARA